MTLFPRLPEPLTFYVVLFLVVLVVLLATGWLIDRETPKGRHHSRLYYRRLPVWCRQPWLYIPETRAELAVRDRLSHLRGLLRAGLDAISGEEYVPETWDPYAGDEPGHPYPVDKSGSGYGFDHLDWATLPRVSRQSGDLDDTIHDAPPRIVEPSRNILEVSAYAAERQRLTLFYERVRAGAAW